MGSDVTRSEGWEVIVAFDEPLSRACAELARTMAGSGASAEVMRAVAHHAADVLGLSAAAVVLLDGSRLLQPVASAGAAGVAGAALVAAELRLGQGPSLEALGTDAQVSAADLAKDVRWPLYAGEARRAGVRAVAAFPLRVGDEPIGALTVMDDEPHDWQPAEVTAAEVLLDLAGGYVARESELDRVRRTAAQLQEALESRVDIEQAKGVLVGELGCTVDQAYLLLRDHARRNNVTLRSVARAVVHLGLRLPAPARRRPESAPAAPTAPTVPPSRSGHGRAEGA
jgi:GAF domain-containing protein